MWGSKMALHDKNLWQKNIWELSNDAQCETILNSQIILDSRLICYQLLLAVKSLLK